MPTDSSNSGLDRRSFLQVAGGSGVVGASTLLAGCSGGGGEETETATDDDDSGGFDTDTEATDTPTEDPSTVETGGTLRVAMQSDISQTLNPHRIPDTTATTVAENLGNSLVRASPNGEIVPEIAKDWTISDDGTTYTFQLREDVTFHEPYDRNLTADDVVWNYRKIFDPDYTAFGAGTFEGILWGEDLDTEETVRKTGEYEVTFELAEPFAPFLIKQASMSAFGWFLIIPPESLEEHGEDLGNLDVGIWGTGPFVYDPDASKIGSEYVLERNPDYFEETDAGQLPYLDRLVFEVAPEGTTRNTALKAGDIDVNESTPATDIESLESSENVNVVVKPSTAKTNMWVNNRNFDPLSKKKVRKAVMHAMNREAIVQTKFRGAAAVAHSPIPPWHWAYDEEAAVTYDHDPERAQQLLEEAGYGDGFEFTVEPTNQPKFVDPAKIMQQQFKQVGIDMAIEPAAKGTTYDPLVGGWEDESIPPSDWNAMIENFTWGFSADDYTFATFHCGQVFNYSYFCNEEADEAMETARRTTDREQRKEAYATAQKIITDNMPKLFILWNAFTPGHRTEVHGFRAWASAYMWFGDVWKEQ